MNSAFTRRNHWGLLIAATALCVVATSLVGCTSRRQYAINESILISERRQLEDEIYRVQFELRDALEENEQLRSKLEEKDPDALKDSSKKKSSSDARKKPAVNTTAPAYERPKTTTDEGFYPGGDALRATSNKSGYNDKYPEYPTLDMEEVSKLPDFAVVPNLRDAQQANANAPATRQAGYQSQRSASGVSQVSYEDPQEEEEYVEEEDPETEDYEEEYADEPSEEEEEEPVDEESEAEDEWAPMPE